MNPMVEKIHKLHKGYTPNEAGQLLRLDSPTYNPTYATLRFPVDTSVDPCASIGIFNA